MMLLFNKFVEDVRLATSPSFFTALQIVVVDRHEMNIHKSERNISISEKRASLLLASCKICLSHLAVSSTKRSEKVIKIHFLLFMPLFALSIGSP